MARSRPIARRRGRGRGRAALLLALALASAGCSTFFVRPPPPEVLWPRLPDAQCTHSRLWPAIDAVLALGVLGRFVLLAPEGGMSRLATEDKVTLSLGVAAFGTGAVVGFARTGRCHAYDAYVHGQRWLAPPLPEQPRPPLPPGQLPESVQPPGQPDDPGDAPPAPEAFPDGIVAGMGSKAAVLQSHRLVRPGRED